MMTIITTTITAAMTLIAMVGMWTIAAYGWTYRPKTFGLMRVPAAALSTSNKYAAQ